MSFDTNSDGIADNRPILRILGEDSMMMVADCNANYIDDGATCDDMTDGNISQSVEVSGDVVKSVDGAEISDANEMASKIKSAPLGSKIKFSIQRGNQDMLVETEILFK